MKTIKLLNGVKIGVSNLTYDGCMKLSEFAKHLWNESESRNHTLIAAYDIAFGETSHLVPIIVKNYLYKTYFKGCIDEL